MRDPFPTQGRYRGRLEDELQAREEKRVSARRIAETDTGVHAKTFQGRNVAGNERVLRAIPVSVEGVAGVVPGTQPGSDEHLASLIRHGSIR